MRGAVFWFKLVEEKRKRDLKKWQKERYLFFFCLLRECVLSGSFFEFFVERFFCLLGCLFCV